MNNNVVPNRVKIASYINNDWSIPKSFESHGIWDTRIAYFAVLWVVDTFKVIFFVGVTEDTP